MMLLERKNLVNELLKKRNKTIATPDLMLQVKALLAEDELRRSAIKERLENNGDETGNAFVFDLLETDRIFHIDQIKAICIEYRLRFLGSNLFKGNIPEEAVSQIKHLEMQHETVLSGFRIMAPSKLFHLKNYDDPLSFTPIGNDYFYLIHKWGNDMSSYRKWLVRPMRDFGSLLVFLVGLSLLFTLFADKYLFDGERHQQFMLVTFLFTFKGICGIALYYCFWKGKNFNSAIWDSEYYNK